MAKAGLKPYMREGTAESAWILLDYIDFVIHIFRTEERKFYQHRTTVEKSATGQIDLNFQHHL